MKRILFTLKEKWSEYLLEILVLIIGIYGAFALENWNDSRLERMEEIKVLNRVKNDLQNTINEFEFLNGIREKVLSGTRGILEHASQRIYEKDEIDTLIGLTLYRPTFNNKMGTIDLLFSTGKINIIKSDSIKNRLIIWPGSIDDTIEEEAYAMKLMQDHYYPKLAEYIYIQDLMKYSLGVSFFGGKIENKEEFSTIDIESDYEGLLNDKEFLNHLSMRASHVQICNSEVNELILQTQDIIKLIDLELEK